MYETALSHPADEESDRKRLIDHHETVAERASAFAQRQYATAPGGTDVSTLVSIAGFVHDIGKAQSKFQAYLREERDDGPNHAALGALVAFHAACERGIPPTDATIPLVAVARHHGRLPDRKHPYEYINDEVLGNYLREGNARSLEENLEDVESDPACEQAARESYHRAVGGEADWEAFTTAFRSGELADRIECAILSPYGTLDSTVKSGEYYAALVQTWSTLVLADKSDAADLDREEVQSPSDPPQRQTLESHVDGLGGDSTGREATLDRLRTEAFEEVNGSLSDSGRGRVHEFIDSDSRVATLALPTGLGKTYTGLGAALSIRDALDGDSTVVYCLPYTSIIDQTAADVQKVFGCSPTREQFTIDHYLEDTVTKPEGVDSDSKSEGDDTDAERYTRDERFLGECWQANLVVTTFVQLFESILGPTNSASTKLPNLTNSVVVLDEPQALPLDDWNRIRDAVALLARAYDAQIILMTATQPRIFAPDDRFEPFPLVADSSRYFQSDTERVSYTFDSSVAREPDPLDYETAATTVLDSLGSNAALAICNTIPSARRFASELVTRAERAGYDHFDLNERYDEVLSGAEADLVDAVFDSALERAQNCANPLLTLHLTTRHRPIDRERLLSLADRLTDTGVPFVFVATQLVEAGVDVSFQHVYRDFAPLDSIVQAAGRCNRNFERERGHVTVWQLAPPDGENPPSEAIYASEGIELLETTRRAIQAVASLPGETVPGTTIADDAVDCYYELVQEQTDVSESEVQACATGKLNEYTLIDDRCLRSVDVVVCRTDEDVQLAQETKSLFTERTFGKAFDRLDRLRDRTISVPVYTREESPIEARANWFDPTEHVGTRWVDARRRDLFDARDGLTNEESVDDYIL